MANAPNTFVVKQFEFGERREAELLEIRVAGTTAFAIYTDEHGEGHLVVTTHREGAELPSVGQPGTLVFTAGGPTGGYWKFEFEGDDR